LGAAGCTGSPMTVWDDYPSVSHLVEPVLVKFERWTSTLLTKVDSLMPAGGENKIRRRGGDVEGCDHLCHMSYVCVG
jgi:hypothetical protein